MNVLTFVGLKELASHFEEAISDSSVRGIVLTSAKPDFSGGMNLDALATMKRKAGTDQVAGIYEGVMKFHSTLRRIEHAGMDPKTLVGGKPVAVALPGTAVGIGYEIPLACHRIIVGDNPSAKIGLPEIRVGIFPGAGGTTRLVRRLGVMAAAPVLFKGMTPSPREALALGLIDEVVPPGDLVDRAREWVLNASGDDIVKPWDRKGYRMPGGTPYDSRGYMTFVGASAMVNGETWGAYPAARSLMSAIYEGALVPFDSALRVEARWFTRVLMNPSSTAMINSLFVNKKTLEKGINRPKAPAKKEIRTVGIIGAGMMGSGIALVSARAGMNVILLDRGIEDARKGKAAAVGILDRDVARGKLAREAQEETVSRIRVESDMATLSDCDLVIEAVFENPDIKAKVISGASSVMRADAVLATNTSTLPVTQLGRSAREPELFLGMHFFSPAHRMALLEIIRGKRTGEAAVALALDYAVRIRKTPIIVNDARFFYANRCIIPYLNEGVRMVREGVRPELVENGARLAGMPVGPLQLLDETSIDLAVSVAEATRKALGDRYADAEIEEVYRFMIGMARHGRKGKAGFYVYDAKGKRTGLWPELSRKFGVADPQPPVSEVKSRLMLIQALEAVKSLEENVLTDVREGDVGAILGWGFAPWSGGPFSWLDIIGAESALQSCHELRARHGSRFAPPRLLIDNASEGKRFTDQ